MCVQDINGTGYIDLEELKTAVRFLILDESNIFSAPGTLADSEYNASAEEGAEDAEHWGNMEHVMDLFAAMDVSKNGKVEYKEFENFYTAVMTNSVSCTLAR